MKNYLKSLFSQIKFLFNILAYPIIKYFRKLKLKIMEKKLADLLVSLSTMKHEKVSKVELLDGKLLFHYLGGKFFVIKGISSEAPNIGYLKVYHETPLVEGNKKPVENFYMKIDNFGNVSITNYVKSSISAVLKAYTQSDTINVLPDEAASSFIKQFDAKMLSEPFEINPE